jgi:hypothetical protein
MLAATAALFSPTSARAQGLGGCSLLDSGLISRFGVSGSPEGQSMPSSAQFDAGDLITLTYTLNGGGGYGIMSLVVTPPGTPIDRLNPNSGDTITYTIPTSGNYTVGWTANNYEEPGSSNFVVGCTPGSGTSITLRSSLNPSQVGDLVTFTATVTSPAGTPTGTVTFLNNGAALGTVPLSGGAADLSTAELPEGTHPIIAQYNPSGAFTPSTSPVLNQVVGAGGAALISSKIVAQTSGQSMQGSIDQALGDAFGGTGNQFTASMTGFYLSYSGSQPARTTDRRAFDIFAVRSPDDEGEERRFRGLLGIGNSSHAADDIEAIPSNWRIWTNVRNTWWNSGTQTGDIQGSQLNVLAGATYIVSPDVAVGAFAGYESFGYDSVPFDSRLAGSGWTGGAYVGWKVTPNYRFDLGVAASALDYSAYVGAASGTFDGTRLFLTTGLTGAHEMGGLKVEPSVKLYSLWENDDAFVDTAGTAYLKRSFSTSRASGGIKVARPFEAGGLAFEPFLGAFIDYYFSTEETAGPNVVIIDAIRDGWSARLTGGLALVSTTGVRATVTGEVGGLGRGGSPHGSVRGSMSIPLN